MLWSASSIRGYAVAAIDGESGTVADLVFDDRDWTIQWLVVDAGTWLSGRQLFVPVAAFGHPDPETRQFSIDLTLAELAGTPGHDLAERSGAGTDTHFRSLAAISQAAVEASDGNVGHAEDFLIDSATWQITYLVVDTSDWWFGEKILISTHAITGIDDSRTALTLDVPRQLVKDGPRFSPEQTVDGAFDESFETYFGIRFVKK